MNSKLTALLIEDNPEDTRLLQLLLAQDRQASIELVCASRLAQGFELLSAHDIDAILLDLSLPDHSGLDTLEQMRTHAPAIPIIVLTGLDDEQTAQQALQLGAQDYLLKGRVDNEVLSRALRYAIERKHAETEIQQRAEQLSLLYDAGLALNQILDPKAQSDFLLKIAKRSLRADRAEFFQLNEKIHCIDLVSAIGFPKGIPEQLRSQPMPARAEDNLVAWVVAHRVPVNLPDVTTDPRYVPYIPEIRAGIWVPVQHEEKLLGVIVLLSVKPNAFSQQDEQLLMLFASQVAVALANARLFAAEQARRKELTSLYDLSRGLTDITDLEAILRLTARQATLTVATTLTRIALLEKEDLVVRAAFPIRPLNQDLQINHRIPLADLPACHRTLTQGTPLMGRAETLQVDGLERQFLFASQAQTICLVPLRAGDHAFGFLILEEMRREDREPFTPEKVKLATSIGDQLASALYRSQLHIQTNHRLEQLTALRNIDQAITGSLDLRVTLDILLAHVVAQLHVDAADVFLFNAQTTRLEFAAGRGFRSRNTKETTIALGKRHMGRAVLERRIINVPNWHDRDQDAIPLAWMQNEKFVAHCSIPLIAKGEIKGVLDVYHRSPLDNSTEWLEFLELLAGEAAIAIDNAGLFENLQRSNIELASAYDSTIEGWSRALDMRDRETEGHSQRVTQMTLDLARAKGISEMELVHVRRGALLHDIGKMGVPDAILLKADELSEQEWSLMRRHPQLAYEMLMPIEYLRPALDIPYCHHEKWDGSGYPRGLRGRHIPLAARIFAIVDVWDAIRSNRPYRNKLSEDQAHEYIREQSGKHFDPQVVEAFLSLVQEYPREV